MIIGIVAIAKNYAMGKDGKLPWHYSADLKFFKETTTGHTVVMGSTTWRSIGRRLPNRLNVVVSKSPSMPRPDGVVLVHSVDEVLKLAETRDSDIFIVGGAAIFKAFELYIDRWIVTEVPLTIEDADVFMPRDFLDGFKLDHTRDLGEDLIVKFYERRSPN